MSNGWSTVGSSRCTTSSWSIPQYPDRQVISLSLSLVLSFFTVHVSLWLIFSWFRMLKGWKFNVRSTSSTSLKVSDNSVPPSSSWTPSIFLSPLSHWFPHTIRFLKIFYEIFLKIRERKGKLFLGFFSLVKSKHDVKKKLVFFDIFQSAMDLLLDSSFNCSIGRVCWCRTGRECHWLSMSLSGFEFPSLIILLLLWSALLSLDVYLFVLVKQYVS